MLELADYIHAVETTAGQYMLPNPTGWFLPGTCEPVLDRSKQYFYAGKGDGVVATAEPIDFGVLRQEDIYNDRGDLVVLRKQIKSLQMEGQYPLRSRNLIVEIVDHLVRTHARWSSKSAVKVGAKRTNVHAAIRPFLLEQFQRSGVSIDGVVQKTELELLDGVYWKSQRPVSVEVEPVSPEGFLRVTEEDKQLFYASQDICDSIMLQLNDLIQLLLEFLGQDRWIMHFMKVSNTQITVERTIDYRIYSWMMEHGRDFED